MRHWLLQLVQHWLPLQARLRVWLRVRHWLPELVQECLPLQAQQQLLQARLWLLQWVQQ